MPLLSQAARRGRAPPGGLVSAQRSGCISSKVTESLLPACGQTAPTIIYHLANNCRATREVCPVIRIEANFRLNFFFGGVVVCSYPFRISKPPGRTNETFRVIAAFCFCCSAMDRLHPFCVPMSPKTKKKPASGFPARRTGPARAVLKDKEAQLKKKARFQVVSSRFHHRRLAGGGRKTWEANYEKYNAPNLASAGTAPTVLYRIDHGETRWLDPKAVVMMIGTKK